MKKSCMSDICIATKHPLSALCQVNCFFKQFNQESKHPCHSQWGDIKTSTSMFENCSTWLKLDSTFTFNQGMFAGSNAIQRGQNDADVNEDIMTWPSVNSVSEVTWLMSPMFQQNIIYTARWFVAWLIILTTGYRKNDEIVLGQIVYVWNHQKKMVKWLCKSYISMV